MGQCDDGVDATDQDSCSADGTCAGVDLCVANNVTCATPPDTCHEPIGTCFRGVCSYDPKPVGGSCDDENERTTSDTCDTEGACVGVDLCDNVTCPLSECIVGGSCFRGVCSYVPAENGTSCTALESSQCTEALCIGGTCVQDVPLSNGLVCDDGMLTRLPAVPLFSLPLTSFSRQASPTRILTPAATARAGV